MPDLTNLKLLTLSSEFDEVFLRSMFNLDSSIDWIKVVFDNYPGNYKRFFAIEDVKDKLGEYTLFSDTNDVAFIKTPPVGNTLAHENQLHKDSWWRSRLVGEFKQLWDEPVYNAGLFILETKLLLEFVEMLKRGIKKGKEGEVNDQLYFNLFIKDCKKRGIVFQEKDEIFRCIHNNYETLLQDTCAIHANGDTKHLYLSTYLAVKYPSDVQIQVNLLEP